MKHIVQTIGDIDVGTLFQIKGSEDESVLIKTNVIQSPSGDIHCCNIKTGMVSILPQGTPVDLLPEEVPEEVISEEIKDDEERNRSTTEGLETNDIVPELSRLKQHGHTRSGMHVTASTICTQSSSRRITNHIATSR